MRRLLTLALVAAGIPICARAARRLGQHDHPAIVWDELACLPIALAVVPLEAAWIAAGFVVFRLFDIAKPWPISTVDRHLGGGTGVMADDLLAALASAAVLYGAVRLVGA
ncbi:MAG: phosphatidylglycerophosphatase A [Halofilum sp. (in: g-proteobacteria)]|nr:phosphatidylglycerophosphatase A [Halofilum sp. (in: g-proteobacteria)]